MPWNSAEGRSCCIRSSAKWPPTSRSARLIAGAVVVGLVAFAQVVLMVNFLGDGGLGDGPLPAPRFWAAAAATLAVLVGAAVVERAILRHRGRGGYYFAKAVGMGMRERPGLVGCVIALLTGELLWLAAPPAASIVAVALAWPRAAELAAASPSAEASAPPANAASAPPIEPL